MDSQQTFQTSSSETAVERRYPWAGLWLIIGIILAGGMALCVWASVNGAISEDTLILITAGMGFIYLLGFIFRPGRLSRNGWVALILLAVVMRMCWFFVPVSSGDDHCRYLWDGAVTANGINPYKYSPKDIADGKVDNPTLKKLADSDLSTLEDINHPQLRTIYPPASQGAFALAHWITPFDLTGWRIILLCFDALAALAVLALLRATGKEASLLAFYLLNPLLVTETYGGCHLDMLTASMLVIFALAIVKNRPVWATLALAMAVGTKLWPVILLPFLVRALWGRWRKMALSAAVFILLLSAMALPFALAFGDESNSGLLTYSRIWSGRAGAYLVLGRLGWWVRSLLSLSLDGHYVGRGLMMLTILPAVAVLSLRRRLDKVTLPERLALVSLLLMLLCPVLWPWYFVAVIPLAAASRPRLGLLLWTALLPLCYLEFEWWQLTLLVHVPLWALLAYEQIRDYLARRANRETNNV
ncbi:MAG TPA: DUF2029 domain-containing protein [Phycisphaerae bacterium]|nr:DUF2029 domain-containing protein [Phycisphaerae bacterium]